MLTSAVSAEESTSAPTEWLSTVLNPWGATAPKTAPAPRAVALALLGRHQEAVKLVEETSAGLSDPDRRFVNAVMSVVDHEPTATESLRKLIRATGSRGLHTAARILLAVALRESNRLDDAAAILEGRKGIAATSSEAHVLEVHWILTAFRQGKYQAAYQRSSLLVEAEDTGPLKHLIAEVAHRNHVSVAWQVGVHVPWQRPARSGVLESIEASLAEGLTVYARDAFDSATESPGSRTFRWSAADPVGGPLETAHRQAELCGDISLVRETARLLGRYMHMAAQDPADYGTSIDLMREADDYEGIKRAVWVLWSRGPLPALRAIVRDLLARDWYPAELKSNHLIVAQGASLLTQRQVASAVRTLRAGISGLSRRARAVDGDPDGALRALSRLLPFAQPKDHASCASWLLVELAKADPRDAILLQAVPQVIDALDWARLPQDTVDRWAAYVERYLDERVDHVFVARAVAVRLARIGVPQVVRLIQSQFDHAPTISSVALFLAGGIPPSKAQRASLVAATTAALDKVQAEARGGTYSLGGFDVGAIAVDLAVADNDMLVWRALVPFLLNPAVATESKEGAIDRISLQPELIPKEVATEISGRIPGLAAPEVPLISGSGSLEVLRLQLALALGGLSPADVISAMIDLAAGTLWQRLAVARMLPAASKIVGSEIALMIALDLVRVSDASVSGAACRSVSLIAPEVRRDLLPAAARAVADVIAGPGALRPLEVIRSLAQVSGTQAVLVNVLEPSLNRLAANHLDGWVRRAARAALQVT